jgi:hypothetical protein
MASHALAGRMHKKAMARLSEIDPTLRVSHLRHMVPSPSEDFARFEQGLRKAGLPECGVLILNVCNWRCAPKA